MPINVAPKKVGERKAKVKIPTKTGAQHALVIPENIPSIKTDNASTLPSFCFLVMPGIGILTPRNVIIETKRSTIPPCLLYTSDAADDLLCVDLGGRRIIKKT